VEVKIRIALIEGELVGGIRSEVRKRRFSLEIGKESRPGWCRVRVLNAGQESRRKEKSTSLQLRRELANDENLT